MERQRPAKPPDAGSNPAHASRAEVAEVADARDLKSLAGFRRAGSNPALGTGRLAQLVRASR